MSESPFLAYDVRGRIGDQIDEELFRKIGLAFSNIFDPGEVVIGRDVRETSESLSTALSEGLMEGGTDVIDIGLCGTECVYFATSHLGAGGGIMVTASHNPRDYNGLKFVGRGSIPISRDNGLHDMRDRIDEGELKKSINEGSYSEADIWEDYTDRVLSFLGDPDILGGSRIVTDPGHGCAGPALDMICERLDIDPIRLHHEPDGTFPAGIPNPLLPEMRGEVRKAVKESDAEMGIAWDGDFDRCFLFDEDGSFVEGYYIVGLIASSMLQKKGGGKIIHDPRLTWNTIDLVKSHGGTPVQNRTGHAFIKARMREENAIYGGEMSAHHYFKDFYHCDTGMVPWVVVLEMMRSGSIALSKLVEERKRKYPVSGEINRKARDQDRVIKTVENRYGKNAERVEHVDGVSIEHSDYRFNLRASNTEPLIRLNVETRGDEVLLEEKTSEILSLMDSVD